MSNNLVIEEFRNLGKCVPDVAIGMRLDEFLSRHFPFFSRAGWQKEIKRGAVLLNSQLAIKSSYRLKGGDEIKRIHPIDEEPECDTNIKVIWKDDDVCILDKPSGLPMHESGMYRRKTVAGIIPALLGEQWSYVHRLDRETSGIVVCARTPELRARLVENWSLKNVRKTYLAIARKELSESSGTIDLPIKAERHERTNRAVISEEGDTAVTKYTWLRSFNGNHLYEVRPITGKTNQIRLHFSAVGSPLVGEKVYGVDPNILEIYRKEGNTERVQQLAGYKRHLLHAWKISFDHPTTGVQVNAKSPPPPDFSQLMGEDLS